MTGRTALRALVLLVAAVAAITVGMLLTAFAAGPAGVDSPPTGTTEVDR